MFFDELTPLVQELAKQPIAFLGGFVAGALRLNLGDDPVRSWLDQQVTSGSYSSSDMPTASQNGKSSGPQTISID